MLLVSARESTAITLCRPTFGLATPSLILYNLTVICLVALRTGVLGTPFGARPSYPSAHPRHLLSPMMPRPEDHRGTMLLLA